MIERIILRARPLMRSSLFICQLKKYKNTLKLVKYVSLYE